MKKILLKISGEALANGGSNYKTEVLNTIAKNIQSLQKKGFSIVIVCGGGNLFRGKELIQKVNILRSTADYIGILATIQNCLILRDFFLSIGIKTKLTSSITMNQICEPYIPQKIERYLEKNYVVILAGGLGQTYFSTDTTCVQRALELNLDTVIMAKNGIDGIYTTDPKKDQNAKKIDIIEASEILERGLGFADASAIALARENNISMQIISIDAISHIGNVIGTKILPK